MAIANGRRPRFGAIGICAAWALTGCGKANTTDDPGSTNAADAIGFGLHLIAPLPEHQERQINGGTNRSQSDVLYVGPDATWVVARSSSVAAFTPTGAPPTTVAFSGSHEVFGYTSTGNLPFGLPPWAAGASIAEFHCTHAGMAANASRLWLVTQASDLERAAQPVLSSWTLKDGFARAEGALPVADVRVSDDGGVVVGNGRTSDGSFVPFTFSVSGGFTELKGRDGGSECLVRALSGDGRVAFGTCSAGPPAPGVKYVAVEWPGRDADPVNARFGQDECDDVVGTNHDATVVAGGCSGSGAFLWRASGVFSRISAAPDLPLTTIGDFTEDGAVAIGSARADVERSVAFRWTPAGGLTLLSPFEGDDTTVLPARRENGTSFAATAFGVRAMSADGSLVAGTSLNSAAPLLDSFPGMYSPAFGAVARRRVGHAFRYTAAGGMQPLDALPGDTWTAVTSVSEDGSIIVGASGDDTRSTAVLWTPDGAPHTIVDRLTAAGYASPSTDLLVTDGAKNARLLWGKAKGPGDGTWAWILRLP